MYIVMYMCSYIGIVRDGDDASYIANLVLRVTSALLLFVLLAVILVLLLVSLPTWYL